MTRTVPGQDERAAAARTGMSVALFARYLPDEPAVTSPTGDRTFAELNANANRLARALRARGLRPGDGVAIACSNRPEFVEAVDACWRSGLRYTPVNFHLTTDEVHYVLDDCEAKAVVGDVRARSALETAAPRCANLVAKLAVGGAIEGFESYDDAVAAENGDDLPDPSIGNRMLYTSGTTGRPKGVVRPPNYSTRLPAITDAPKYAAGTGQRNLCTGPLCHGGPLSFSLAAPLANGVGIVLMERWDAAHALRLIEQYRITHTHMVPTMFHRLLQLPEEVRRQADVSSLRYVLHGAAPCSREVKHAMIAWFGPVLHEYYASTEGSGASCSAEEWLAKPGTVGRPPTPEHVRILDDEGRPCAPGETGTIFLQRSDMMDFAYFKDAEKTERARRGGYFTVGDVGHLDEDGYLFITDRIADLIVRGGVNVYPAEVEAALASHPSVRDVAVVGVPHAEWGEEVLAAIELREGDEGDESLRDGLARHARERLAVYKVPSRIDFVAALPRGENGKLHRHQVRARYRAAVA